MPYFVVVRPELINGRLAAIGGKVLLHLPNYFEIVNSRPVLKDDALQVFEVQPDPAEVREVRDGDKTKHLLWKGDMSARSRPHELVSVVVLPSTNGMSTADQVKEAFAGLPKSVQLAGVLETCTNEDLVGADAALKSTAEVRAWSRDVLTKHVEAMAKARV
jgi:hypothetical protein